MTIKELKKQLTKMALDIAKKLNQEIKCLKEHDTTSLEWKASSQQLWDDTIRLGEIANILAIINNTSKYIELKKIDELLVKEG